MPPSEDGGRPASPCFSRWICAVVGVTPSWSTTSPIRALMNALFPELNSPTTTRRKTSSLSDRVGEGVLIRLARTETNERVAHLGQQAARTIQLILKLRGKHTHRRTMSARMISCPRLDRRLRIWPRCGNRRWWRHRSGRRGRRIRSTGRRDGGRRRMGFRIGRSMLHSVGHDNSPSLHTVQARQSVAMRARLFSRTRARH